MRYLLADVFTDAPFAGNQLAVFPDAAGLDGRQMQAIARELNIAETSFVTPGSAPGTFAVRIFTPASELPFAGHPTIGTAVVLKHLGRTEGLAEIVLEEGVGPVRVVLGDVGATLFMDGPAEQRPHTVMPVVFADALGLKRDRLVGTPWQAGYGTPFMFVEVESREDVAGCHLIAERWKGFTEALWANRAVYVFAITGREGTTMEIHARMFAPKMGIVEDPATGSAAAALAGSMDCDATHMIIHQGVEMGRPSEIFAEIRRDEAEKVVRVAIYGEATVIADGNFLRLP
ncbi:MAG: PhzF family phenazine biosynthesis protein [Acetobacteraceae bacterium]|nr:PhzF family phenazine biosynthesis protein [Acetobacteraceae bacterium]